MEKKLFCFQPSSCWSYCGGGMCIVAKDFNEAVELGKKEDSDNDFFLTNEAAIAAAEVDNKTFYKWTLKEAIPTYPDEESRIVLLDYNWG